MAKKSSIAKNLRRQRLVEKYAAKRAEYKSVLANPEAIRRGVLCGPAQAEQTPPQLRPRCGIRNRCAITGRPRAFIRRFGLSRLTFREMALDGQIPGVTKSSW